MGCTVRAGTRDRTYVRRWAGEHVGRCAFKIRAGHKCGRPTVGHRDLVGQYPKGLTRQAVCELHQRAVDHKPPPLAHPDAPRSEAP
jgi:hypothetical protein